MFEIHKGLGYKKLFIKITRQELGSGFVFQSFSLCKIHSLSLQFEIFCNLHISDKTFRVAYVDVIIFIYLNLIVVWKIDLAYTEEGVCVY